MSGDALTETLGAVLLLCALALLAERRLAVLPTLLRIEGAALTAASLWQAHLQQSGALIFTAIVTLALDTVLFPARARWMARRLRVARLVPALPAAPALLLGLGLLGLAILVVPVDARQNLTIPLAIILLGLLAMLTHRNPLAQALGFLSAGNGLLLAAIGSGLPSAALLAIALAGLAALFGLGVYVLRLRDDGSIDLAGVAAFGRPRR